jgi:hypothetical protein
MLRDGPDDNEGVVRVLKHGTGEVVYQRVKEEAVSRGVEDHLLKNINNDIKQERGEWVALPKPTTALDPFARHSIEEHRRLTRLVEHFDPCPPEFREPLGKEDAVQGFLADGIEGFPEVEFKDRSRRRPFVATLDNVSSVDEVLSDGATRDETSLVRVYKVGNKVAESEGKAFGVNFEAAVLERNGSEVFRFVGTFLLGEKDNVCFVYRPQVKGEAVEAREGIKQILLNKVPILFEESRSETVRSRARIVVHGEKGSSNFFKGERADQGSCLRRREGSGGNKGR